MGKSHMDYLKGRLKEIEFAEPFILKGFELDPYQFHLLTDYSRLTISNFYFMKNAYHEKVYIEEDTFYSLRVRHIIMDIVEALGDEMVFSSEGDSIFLDTSYWRIEIPLSPQGYESLLIATNDGSFIPI